MPVQVFDKSLINGRVCSRSFSFETLQEHVFTGAVDFSNGSDPSPLLDPAFSYVLKMLISLDARREECVAVHEFPLNPGAQVIWTGIARRVFLTLETSRIVPASLSISF